jgi:hypothetical protein
MPVKRTLIAAGSFLVFGAPGTALATVHTGQVAFEEPQNPPSLGNPPPAVQAEAHQRQIAVAYDDQAGTITFTAENFEPTFWGPTLNEDQFEIGPRCEEGGEGGTALVEGSFHGASERVRPSALRNPTGPWVMGKLGLRGFQGELEATGTFIGQTFTIVYTDPYLAGLELRCVTLVNGGSPLTFSLGSYPPPPKTHRATKAQTRAMEAVASAHRSGGFNRRFHHFLTDRITSNGWAAATWSIFPHNGQPETIVFELVRGRWHVITDGSAVCEPRTRIPVPVCEAL